MNELVKQIREKLKSGVYDIDGRIDQCISDVLDDVGQENEVAERWDSCQ